MLKVGILGSFGQGSLEESYARAFELTGAAVSRFDLPGINHRGWRTLGLTRVEQEISVVKPDVLLVIKGLRLPESSGAKLKSRVGSFVNFNPDSPWENVNSSKGLIASIGRYDAHFTWSRDLVSRFYETGAKAAYYLPFGYDPALHSTHQSAPHNGQLPQYDAVFMGTFDSQRDKVLSLLAASHTVFVCGNGWERAKKTPESVIHSQAVYGEGAVKIMQNGYCVINLLRTQNLGSHNMKTFEIPATGNLMVTQRSVEQQEFFPEQEASLQFGDIEELRKCVDFAVADRQRARAIAARGFELAEPHTYTTRAITILETLGFR